MEMIKKFIRMIIWPDEEERLKKRLKLSEKVTFRCTKEERILIEKYCDLRKMDISEYMRILNHNHITKFIIDNS